MARRIRIELSVEAAKRLSYALDEAGEALSDKIEIYRGSGDEEDEENISSYEESLALIDAFQKKLPRP